MNQGRIWCVVNPSVGLPLFLGSVTLIALLVHYAILSHTTWFSAYWQGSTKTTTSQVVNPAAAKLAYAETAPAAR
jgi:light-harvesting protein B-800-850 alpha chain